ncbi:hypothetical protein [Pedobacter sp. MW01-1-1]|uniref:hypothetical protein n=1 Tax=Pedobacter sp. MW01-1-1 TaxID=3383027 RepID=UPI003FEE7AE7
MTTGRKITNTLLIIILLLVSGYLYYHYFFVLGTGVKAGQLNYIVHKGYVFKTYEGKLVQLGIKSGGNAGSVQNNEFEFSVSDEKIAQKMMENGGKYYELHYKEYNNSLPWRGYSKYVVDSIYSMRDN